MKKYSKENFIEKLNTVDWSIVTRCTDVNVAWEKFKTIFTLIINEVAPEKEIRIKCRTEPWINCEILDLIKERDRALIQLNKNKSDSELRNKYNKL